MIFTSEVCDDVLTKHLEFENDHAKQLGIIEEHINKFVSGNISWDAMYTLIPVMKITYEDMLQKHNETAKSEDLFREPERLSEVENNLEILSKYLVALGLLSDYFISKDEIKIDVVKSFPVCLSEVVLLTFDHCRDSTSIYKFNENPSNCKNLLDTLRKLFKTASAVHSKLLKMLLQFSTCNAVNEPELTLLTEVLNALVNLSASLMNFNFKLCADTWNSFLNLLKKHAERIFGLFSFDKPLKILMEFSIVGLEGINRDYRTIPNICNINDAESMNKVKQHLKEQRFVIRVLIKMYQKISLRNSDCKIFWIYFIQLYRFSKPIMILETSNHELIKFVNEYIFEEVQPLISAIICGFKFQQITNPSSALLKAIVESRGGFLLLINEILLSSNVNLNNNDVVDILQATFSAVKYCKCTDFFRNNIVIATNDTSHDLYAELLVNLTCYILTLPKDSYAIAETTIITNIFSENTSVGCFSLDLIGLLIRQTNPSYCYDVICDMIDRNLSLVTAMHTDTTDHYRVSSVLRTLYSHGPLDESMRTKLLTKYPLPSMPGPWRHLGLHPLPKSRSFVQGMMLEYAEKVVHEFWKGSCAGKDGFMQMIQYLEILSSVPWFSWSPSEKSKLAALIENIWIFDSNNLVLLTHPLFSTYLRTLTKLSSEQSELLDGLQIKKIINQLKMIMVGDPNNDKFKYFTIRLLNKCTSMLSAKENMFDASTIAEVLNGIFPDNNDNDYLRREALRAIEYADKSILRDSVITQFSSRSTTDVSAVTHFHGLYSENIRSGSGTNVEFLQHQCIDWSAVADNGVCSLPGPSSSSVGCAVANVQASPLQLRDRDIREQMGDVTRALDCIRNDLKVLQTYHKTYKFSQKNVASIFNILDDLKRLV